MTPGPSQTTPDSIPLEWKLSSYDYFLPEELIAAFPAAKRTQSRLIRIDRQSGQYQHHTFSDLPGFLKAGDVLVLNNTKVFPARLLGRRASGAKAEVFLLRENGENVWEALVKPSGRVDRGDILFFEAVDTALEVEVLDEAREGTGARSVRLIGADARSKVWKLGRIPLPPYIQRETTPEDLERYQTVFAAREGAVAAPTAGLHFDESLLQILKAQGVEIVYVTLHTGYGTFQPVNAEDIRTHQMFEEHYEISPDAAEAINRAKKEGRRIIACGTTTVRTLESAVGAAGEVAAGPGVTGLFIYPPFQFRVADAMITNFHLPKSSLLMLVSAFLGYEKLMQVYRAAVEEKYRFYSYGDAMIIE